MMTEAAGSQRKVLAADEALEEIVISEEIAKNLKCTKPFAAIAATNVKYLSNLQKENQFIVETVFRKGEIGN